MNFPLFHRMRHAMQRMTLAGRSALCVLLLCPLLASASSPEERYDEVKTNFEKGDFTRAQYLGEAMLKDGQLSPQLFHLLGHIRYRQGDLGRAALWYSRASLFPPPVQEIRQNITHIHEHTGNVRFPANTLLDQFSSRLSRTQWIHMAVISGWIVLFSLALSVVMRSFALRTLWVLIGVVALNTAAVAALGWVRHPSYKSIEKLAVVTAPSTKAYTAATVTSGSVSSLPPGSEVRKLEERGAWCYVEIAPPPQTSDDTGDRPSIRGWVQMDALTPYWPFDPAYLE